MQTGEILNIIAVRFGCCEKIYHELLPPNLEVFRKLYLFTFL